MASDLRTKLDEAWRSGHYLSGYDAMEKGARLALESLPCRCDFAATPGEMKSHGMVVQCDRCERLASLTSEGKGG